MQKTYVLKLRIPSEIFFLTHSALPGAFARQTQERINGTAGKPRGTYYARREALVKDLTKVMRVRLRKGYKVCYGAPRSY